MPLGTVAVACAVNVAVPDVRPAEPDLGPLATEAPLAIGVVPAASLYIVVPALADTVASPASFVSTMYGPMNDPTVPVVVAGGVICRLGGVGAGAGVCTRTALTICVTAANSGSPGART